MKIPFCLFLAATLSLAIAGKGKPQSGPWFATTVTYNQPYTTIVYPPGEQCAFALPERAFGKGPLAFVTTTTVGSLLGNLNGKTLSAVLSLPFTGAPQFTYWAEGEPRNTGPFPSHVRLFFSNQTGFSTSWGDEVWYSNPVRIDLANLLGLRQTLSELVDPAQWSNGQGQWGSDRLAGFTATASNVRQVGLAFGGGSFFDVGIGIVNGTGSATMHIETISAQ